MFFREFLGDSDCSKCFHPDFSRLRSGLSHQQRSEKCRIGGQRTPGGSDAGLLKLIIHKQGIYDGNKYMEIHGYIYIYVEIYRIIWKCVELYMEMYGNLWAYIWEYSSVYGTINYMGIHGKQ